MEDFFSAKFFCEENFIDFTPYGAYFSLQSEETESLLQLETESGSLRGRKGSFSKLKSQLIAENFFFGEVPLKETIKSKTEQPEIT